MSLGGITTLQMYTRLKYFYTSEIDSVTNPWFSLATLCLLTISTQHNQNAILHQLYKRVDYLLLT